MLVYGPTARGALRRLSDQMGAKTLNDLDKPLGWNWERFTVAVLEEALAAGRTVLFDLTHVSEIGDVLNGRSRYADTITGFELRYLREHWDRFQRVVQFYENDQEREPPW